MYQFVIHSPEVQGNLAIFRYSIGGFSFVEKHAFDFDIKDDRTLRDLAIATSVSYYKLHLAPEVHVAWHLSDTATVFWQWIFRNGFSELAYKNKLDWSVLDRVTITSEAEAPAPEADHQPLTEGAVVGIGGGKDSSLVTRLLQDMSIDVLGYATEINPPKLIEVNVRVLGIPFSPVRRTLDPQLKTLKEGMYQGHIPVSLIYAFTGILIASQQGKKYVFVGNEASADEETAYWLDRPVNHQWSKSGEFEEKVQSYVKAEVHPDLTYASLLRPLASARIIELFTKNLPDIHQHFSSCNENFKVASSLPAGTYWCGVCAKCLGTYLLMAEYLDKASLKNIFGKNLEDDASLADLMRALLGLTPEKPYDCVATRDEMCLAMTHLRNDIKRSPLVATLSGTDWTQIEASAIRGQTYKDTLHPHHLPLPILEKLLKVL